MRSISAAVARAEREQQRQLRTHQRELKRAAKLAEIELASLEVEEFEERIENLLSVHKYCGPPVDWRQISQQAEPRPSVRGSEREDRAIKERNAYVPSIFDWIFRRINRKRGQLDRAVQAAHALDEASYRGALGEFTKRLASWQASQELAAAVLSGDRDAYNDAYEDLNPLAELMSIGCGVSVSFPRTDVAVVDLVVEGDAVVPKEQKSRTKTGKLSTKAMPTGRYWELYQDYVCGCVLRCAREMFACLPLELVATTARATMLNQATGRLEVSAIVSALVPRGTVDTLNFDYLDPSESMQLFVHTMGFKRSKGFSAVEPVDFRSIEA